MLFGKDIRNGKNGEEEDVGSYRMTLRKSEDTENWKRKHCISLWEEFDLEQAKDLSKDRLLNEWMEK